MRFPGAKKEELHGAVPLGKGCLLEHRTEVCTRDHAGIAAEPAGLDVGFGCDIPGFALGQHVVGDLQRDADFICYYSTSNHSCSAQLNLMQ